MYVRVEGSHDLKPIRRIEWRKDDKEHTKNPMEKQRTGRHTAMRGFGPKLRNRQETQTCNFLLDYASLSTELDASSHEHGRPRAFEYVRAMRAPIEEIETTILEVNWAFFEGPNICKS